MAIAMHEVKMSGQIDMVEYHIRGGSRILLGGGGQDFEMCK